MLFRSQMPYSMMRDDALLQQRSTSAKVSCAHLSTRDAPAAETLSSSEGRPVCRISTQSHEGPDCGQIERFRQGHGIDTAFDGFTQYRDSH